jgi:hypothetical protein
MTNPDIVKQVAGKLTPEDRAAVSVLRKGEVSELRLSDRAYRRLRNLKLIRGLYSIGEQRFVVGTELGEAVALHMQPATPEQEPIVRKPLALKAHLQGNPTS